MSLSLPSLTITVVCVPQTCLFPLLTSELSEEVSWNLHATFSCLHLDSTDSWMKCRPQHSPEEFVLLSQCPVYTHPETNRPTQFSIYSMISCHPSFQMFLFSMHKLPLIISGSLEQRLHVFNNFIYIIICILSSWVVSPSSPDFRQMQFLICS